MRKHSSTFVMRERWILWRQEIVTAQCALMSQLKKASFSPFSAYIQFEQNNIDTARKKSGQLLKQINNEHLVNGYEDAITNLCQKQDTLLSKVCPCSYRTIEDDGWSHAMIWFRHLPTTTFPKSSDPEHRGHSLPIPLPDSPLHVATPGWTRAMGLGWKGERKGKEVFSFSVCTHVWGHYRCAAVSLQTLEACEVAASIIDTFVGLFRAAQG